MPAAPILLPAPADAPWSSVRAARGHSPKAWHGMDEGAIILKDTRGSFYVNKLVRPGVFEYMLPRCPSQNEVGVVGRLYAEADAVEKTVVVRLFGVINAADHYFGEWLVDAAARGPAVKCPYVTLRRVRTQSAELLDRYRLRKRERSWSEEAHAAVLHEWFPPGWLVEHEPFAAVHLDAPLVRDGTLRTFSGDQYTIDYVACDPTGCVRVCVESKANLADARDPVAVEKCTALRDKSLCRVVTFAGHGEDLRVLDFGPPARRERDRRVRDRGSLPRGDRRVTPVYSSSELQSSDDDPLSLILPPAAAFALRLSLFLGELRKSLPKTPSRARSRLLQ